LSVIGFDYVDIAMSASSDADTDAASDSDSNSDAEYNAGADCGSDSKSQASTLIEDDVDDFGGHGASGPPPSTSVQGRMVHRTYATYWDGSE